MYMLNIKENFSHKTVSVDLDSTLVDLSSYWIDYANMKDNTNYKVQDIDSYDFKPLIDNFDYIYKNDLYDNMKPIKDAIKFILVLKEYGFNVQIVTHTYDEHKTSKINFIKKWFGDIDVICTGSCKLNAIKNTYLVDDKLQHIEEHKDINNGIGCVYSMHNKYNYNKTDRVDIKRIGNYKEILKDILKWSRKQK